MIALGERWTVFQGFKGGLISKGCESISSWIDLTGKERKWENFQLRSRVLRGCQNKIEAEAFLKIGRISCFMQGKLQERRMNGMAL